MIWNNAGPTIHTVGATDNSWVSEVLQKGQSYSHTFSSAGTFNYLCTLHPFMTGTVVVK